MVLQKRGFLQKQGGGDGGGEAVAEAVPTRKSQESDFFWHGKSYFYLKTFVGT